MKTKQELLNEIKEINQAIEESTSNIEIDLLYATLEDVKQELRQVIGW